jgi:hypothetical protein
LPPIEHRGHGVVQVIDEIDDIVVGVPRDDAIFGHFGRPIPQATYA